MAAKTNMAVGRAAVTSYSAQRTSLEGMCLQAYGRTSPWQVRLQMQSPYDSVAMVASCLSPGWKAWSKQSQDGARAVLFAPQAHRVKQQRIWRGMNSTLQRRGGGGGGTCDLQSLDFDHFNPKLLSKSLELRKCLLNFQNISEVH